MSHHIGLIFGLLSVAMAVGFLALYGRERKERGADVAMAYGLMAWMVFDNLAERASGMTREPQDDFVEFTAYQVCLAAASLLVLVGADMPSIKLWRMIGFQVLGGGTLLASWSWSEDIRWYAAWQWFNALFVLGVIVFLLRQVRVDPHAKSVTRAGLSIFLLLCGLAGAWPLAFAPWLAPIGIHMLPAVLVCAWWLLSDRSGRFSVMVSGPDSKEGIGDHDVRQRVAQDVHDGVGAHLVAILSSLDPRDIKQKDLALSLEQCVLDIKILVDNLADEVSSPIEALAMLRYRMQPCLDRIGVRMIWEVEEHPAMGEFDRLTVGQLLKIAQEAMANAMRHAQATEVLLRFQFDVASKHVDLLVADNGNGFDLGEGAPAHRGKGLAGMHRRAKEMGAVIKLDSAPGKGTRVQLSLPVSSTCER
jgi:two-component sensor histidine kinase